MEMVQVVMVKIIIHNDLYHVFNIFKYFICKGMICIMCLTYLSILYVKDCLIYIISNLFISFIL
jgi:hypothetical protein